MSSHDSDDFDRISDYGFFLEMSRDRDGNINREEAAINAMAYSDLDSVEDGMDFMAVGDMLEDRQKNRSVPPVSHTPAPDPANSASDLGNGLIGLLCLIGFFVYMYCFATAFAVIATGYVSGDGDILCIVIAVLGILAFIGWIYWLRHRGNQK